MHKANKEISESSNSMSGFEVQNISKEEKNKLLNEFNRTEIEYPKNKTIQELFEEQVEKKQDDIAVIFNDKRLTYKELNDKSNSLARVLRKKGVKAETIVGIMADKSLEMIIGIVAILKAGGAYLPIDPNYPEDRIKYMIQDSKLEMILIHKNIQNDIDYSVELIELEDRNLYINKNDNLDPIISPNNLAYIIYTSGSTGKPKGVLVEHKGVCRLVKNANYISFLAPNRILQTGSLVFDASTFEIWGALLNGGELYIADKEVIMDAYKMKELLSKYEITTILLTSALFNYLSKNDPYIFSKLNNLLIGGDVVSPEHINRVLIANKNLKIINAYGPTENTTISTTFAIDKQYDGNIPIGKPISNSTAYILGENLEILPIGEVGELCVGGDGVARGYLNRRELTEEKFVENPFKLGSKIYRTGDLARWLPDGNIEYLGRIDSQVKIRGFRIEIGEIESQLLKIKEIGEAVVLLKSDDNGDKYLCAYITSNSEIETTLIKKELSKKLPSYMVPSYIIEIERIPLTANGKVDKKLLLEIDLASNKDIKYEPAGNEIEKKMVEIWEKALGKKHIGINDSFLELGGHSLKAIAIMSDIKKYLGVEVNIKELFEEPTIKSLSKYIGKLEKKEYIKIEKAENKEYYAVSSSEKRMFAIWALDKNNIAYNIPLILEINNEVDKDRVKNVLNKLIERHESLRTSFEVINGEVVQKIIQKWQLDFKYEEKSKMNIKEEIRKFINPFGLTKAPLMRSKLIKYDNERYVFMIDCHHIVVDGVSVGILKKEFIELYKGGKLGTSILQYKDYSEWQNSLEKNGTIKEQEKYWLNRFEGEIPVLNIQTDYKRPSVKSYEGNTVKATIDKKVYEKINKLAKENGTTPYMVLLAAYNILLSKYSGQEDIVIGTAEAGRPESELQDVVGMFVNTVALRNYPIGNKTFKEFLEEVKHNTLKDFENTSYQFENLINKLDIRMEASRNPLFDVMFVFEDLDFGLKSISKKIKAIEWKINISKFDLTLTAQEVENGIMFSLEYCSKLFKNQTVERIMEHYINILNSVTINPNSIISEIDMISKEEKNKLLIEFNETEAAYPKDKTIKELFEEQVEKTPNNIAIVFDNKELTYKELNEKANSLARVLREKGVKAETIVGIMVERSIEMIIGILAILKAGGAYLPIDPKYPEGRKKYIFEDSKIKLIITQNKFVNMVNFGVGVINVEDVKVYSNNVQNLENINTVRNLAYIIYTSGTTGNPKGVMIENRSLVNRLNWMQKKYPLNSQDIILQKTTYTFDVSVWELLWWSLVGAKLCILKPEKEKEPKAIIDTIEKNKVTTIHFVPSMLNAFMEYIKNSNEYSKIKTLKRLFTSGEALGLEQVEEFKNITNNKYKIDLINLYGPTEATIDVSYFNCSIEHYETSIPIGRPIDNIKLYIINKYNKSQPIGVAGELCIAGDGLARGYLNRTELTSEKFVENPFETGKKMYRTGDLARWLSDGNIEYLGRIDNQVKIRGFRIETGEIENQLLKLDDIERAVVVAKDSNNKDKYLCAYITAESEVSATLVKKELSKELPSYMLPSYIVQIEKIPLTLNGKVDRKSLPEIDISEITEDKYESPRNKIEEILVKVWEEVLGIEGIGIDHNYYELGGDSIKSIQIVSRLHKYIKITIKDIMQYPTIRDLSEHVKYNNFEVEQGTVEGNVELSPIQEWFYKKDFSEKDYFNQAFVFYKKGGINEEILRKTFLELLKHHDALRMIYAEENCEVKQINRGLQQLQNMFTIDKYDLRGDNNYSKTIEILSSKLQQGMDIERGILLKFGVFKTKEEDYVLIAIHHLVIDIVSWKILLEDLENTYKSIEKGEKVILPQKTTSYKEWTLKLKEYGNSKEIMREINYWKTIEDTDIKTLPRDFKKCESTFGESENITVSLSNEKTEELLRKTSMAYNTQINDILLCALGLAVKEWSGNEKVLVSLEGHGREDIISDIYIDRTIGWFTSIYPVILDMAHSDNISYCIKNIKETLRHIPNEGIGYGILKYLTTSENNKNIKFKLKPEISFNYLGEFVQSDKSLFKYSKLSPGESVSRSNKKLYSIEINGEISNGEFKLHFNYSTKEYKHENIKKLSEIYMNNLNKIIEHCESKKISEKTPWDYGDKDLSIEDLDKIILNQKGIEKIHSLTPMQERTAYVMSINKGSHVFFEQSVLMLEGDLNVEILNKALNKVIEKYEILRTAFLYGDISKQVILRKRPTSIFYKDISNFDEKSKEQYIKDFVDNDMDNGFDLANECLIRIAVVKTYKNKYKIVYSFHHIILDGWSNRIITKEIVDTYKTLLEGKQVIFDKVEPYSNYLQWLDKQDESEAIEYWRSYLNGYNQKIEIPKSIKKKSGFENKEELIVLDKDFTKKLKNISEINNITLSSLIQTAWGVVLQKYNNTNDVVFGSMVSGRTSEINGIENMVGLFINVIAVRVKGEDNAQFIELAKTVNRDFIKANGYNYLTFEKVQKLVRVKDNLISTILIYENYPDASNSLGFDVDDKSEVKIAEISSFEQTVQDFAIMVVPDNNLNIIIKYNANVYSREIVNKIGNSLCNILNCVVRKPHIELYELNIVNPK
ncbi:non-ribosomal peptide synthetase [Clostridium felsineum]|uniref:non-ribosomal peptide synthetase n=1 Tax=Clostridium felsineum TaxID=36839 RepID=UPI00098BD26D|nr:non-ribosomal peptide synthetase [Clostridium felsineum]URZ03767.1 Tyrocidine synthase 2 [Clostridium felsineum]